MAKGVPGRGEGTGLRKQIGMGNGRKNTPIMCQRASTAPAHPYPTSLCLILLFRRPHPALHSPLLQELEGSREASKRGSSKRVMVWCRVGQGRARRLLSPGSPKPVYSTLGVGMQGLFKEARGGSGQQGRGRRSLLPTLVHRADLGSPQPGWLR